MYIVHILYGEGFLRGTPLHLFQQGVPLSNTKKTLNIKVKGKRKKKNWNGQSAKKNMLLLSLLCASPHSLTPSSILDKSKLWTQSDIITKN